MILKEINIQYCYKIFGQNRYISPLESETLFNIMRKSLLLVVALIVSFASTITAQSMFEAPDTVCVNQPVQLKTNRPLATSHYWGFCSGYMFNKPEGKNLGSNFQLDGAADIVMSKDDDGNYYGFVVNVGTTAADHEFLRLEFGESLENTPKVTNFGNMNDILPRDANSMYLVRDPEDKRWYIFLTAGQIANTSRLARIDFGTSLANTPNIVNFGNLEGKLNSPTGVFVAKSKDKWYGFLVNQASDQLVRFDMDTNISLTPTIVDVTFGSGSLSSPTDIGVLKENDKWFFFITGANDNVAVTRVDMDSLTNITPTAINITTSLSSVPFGSASAITMVRDCDRIYGLITNIGSHDIIRMEMGGIQGPYDATNFTNTGQVLGPAGLTNIIRDRDNIYSYVINQANNTISQLKFAQCNNTNIQYSLSKNPPAFQYDTAGLYNLYYAVNEGMPDMQVECKLIYVAPIPPIIMSTDTTICEGDTAFLEIISINAISYSWTPNYNISSTSKSAIKVWPDFTNTYRVKMPFPIGTCVVDTAIKVNVVKIKADAGPNRTIQDGASTMLGGPETVKGRRYLRRWFPEQYIDDIYAENPIVRPPHDFTYYLTVVDSGSTPSCAVTDTVIVYVECEGLNLPNVFTPESGGPRSTFGLMNSQLVKLETFSIYDRWGKQVFTTTDPAVRWDGTINGEKAAVGVYMYTVTGYCNSGRLLRKQGNVTLLR